MEVEDTKDEEVEEDKEDDSKNTEDEYSATVDAREGYSEEPRMRARGESMAERPDFGPGEETVSVYGPEGLPSPEEAAALVPPSDRGHIWHAIVIGEGYKHARDLEEDGTIKPRRPIPTVTHQNFFNSLVKTEDGRYLFSGVLNGWPAMRNFELQSITQKKKLTLGRNKIKRVWTAGEKSAPAFPEKTSSVRVTLRAPAWSIRGYSRESPGAAFWFMSQLEEAQVHYGTNMVAAAKALGDPEAVRIHSFAHRYARGKKPETTKDKITWHTMMLMEWSHGKYCTVMELATFNGVGGRFGKANWFEDKRDARPILYQKMPAMLIAPWKGEFAEVRCYDVESKNLEEFMAYFEKWTGPDKYFLDVKHIRTDPIRLTHRKQSDIITYILNYVERDRRYTEEFRNCQSFYADFVGFLAAKSGIEPYFRGIRAFYKNRSHLFLYDNELFEFADNSTFHK